MITARDSRRRKKNIKNKFYCWRCWVNKMYFKLYTELFNLCKYTMINNCKRKTILRNVLLNTFQNDSTIFINIVIVKFMEKTPTILWCSTFFKFLSENGMYWCYDYVFFFCVYLFLHRGNVAWVKNFLKTFLIV